MNRFIGAILLISCLSGTSFAQNKDTAYVNLTNFKLFPGSTFSWRGTNTYYDMTPWDSSPFSEGSLKQKSGSVWKFRMNYRLMYPGAKAGVSADKSGWDPNYKPGYPIIVFLNGGGERGNCWIGNPAGCYCGTGSGCDPNATPIPGTDLRFLNNDNVLSQGGQTHLNSVILAGTKKPDDASLNVRAFPGFLLYPQNINTWGTDNTGNSDLSYALRIVRLLVKQLNIDPNRIYLHGLSLGGQGVYKAMNMADWLFACTASMSGIDYSSYLQYDSCANIPLWVFQGGLDTQVTPTQSAALIYKFRQAGGNARYTVYPTLGHGTWNTAYAEPDFFTWLLSHDKSNIHVPFDSPYICGSTGKGVTLDVAQGFYAYQWEQDGKIIPGAVSNTLLVNVPGIFRARFSRISKNPTESEWNRWSDPVTISEKTPEKPVLQQTGTIVLSDLNGNKNATISGPTGYTHYYWYKNGVATTLPDQNVANISGCSATTNCPNTGAYTLVTTSFDLCPSPPSDPKYLVLGVNNSGLTPPIITLPTNLVARSISPSSALFTWNDNSKNERGYELWRKVSTDVSTTAWKLAVLTGEDVTQFNDTGLQPGTTYYYKIRAVNNTGRSDYFPDGSNSATNPALHNVIITTSVDTQKPTPPQNLTVTPIGIRTLQLSWNASTDESGIKDYYVYYGTDSILVGSSATTFTLTSTQLALNTVYNFTVRGIDLYGNVSSKSSQVSGNTYVDGLYYEHSTGAWTDITKIPWTSTPEFKGHVPNITLAGPPPLGPRTQDDYFNFKFYGYLYITTAGSYTFTLYSNDGAEVFIDGASKIQRKGTITDGVCSSKAATVTLSAGPHYVEIHYYDYTGTQCLDLQYKGADTGSGTKPPSISIPDAKWRSYNTITPPVAPPVVTSPTATPISMSQINVAWTYSGSASDNFEVYRSPSSTGTYAMIQRVSTTTFSDINLTPGTTYYYKIKTVNANGTSAFSAIASATTLTDAQAPTQPTSLAVTASTFTTVSLVWNVSTDNVLVTGYEIWANGSKIGTSSINGFLATNLIPNATYNFSVIAYDASGNKSVASNTVITSTSTPDIYYSKASGGLSSLTTWGKNTDGTGTLASSFSNNGQYFIVSNRTTSSLGGVWSVDGSISKVIVPAGVTLTVDNPFTARTEVQGDGVVNLNSASIPQFISISPTSTVNYNYSNLGNTYIQQNTYGNLGLYGAGNKVFTAGTTTVVNDITVDAGVAFKGAPDNTSKLIVGGNITINGAPAFTPPDFGMDLELSKNGTQNITTSGDLYFDKIATTGSSNTTSIINNGTPVNLNLGSYVGGGLSIPTGNTLNVNNNTIMLSKNASINGNNETGRIAIANGSFDLTSTSNLNSNIYLDPTNNTAKLFNINLTGSGKALIKQSLKITDAIKIKNGELNSAGNITLNSTATTTANIQEIEGNGSITGDVNVQRYIDPKGQNIYRYISTSVDGTTIAKWQNFFAINGNFTGYSVNKNTNMFIYDKEAWIAYPPALGTNQAPIEKGRGYSVFLRNATTPIVLQIAGNPYQGDINFPLNPDPTASSTDGWSLVGNPYASTIVWGLTGWTRSGLSSSISVRDNPAGIFMYYDYATGLGSLTGGKIAPGQAFWVQANTATPALTITEKAKVVSQQTFFRQETNPVSHITLSLKQGALEDVAYIAFTDYGTDGQDAVYDAVKQINTGLYSFSSLTSNKVSTAINNMSNSFCSTKTKLNVQYANPGAYSIVVSEVESLGTIGQIVLQDNFTKTSTPVTEGFEYPFTITSDTASIGANRFSLTISRPDLTVTNKVTTTNICNVDSASVTLIGTQAGVDYTVFNSKNEPLAKSFSSGTGDLVMNIAKENLNPGANALTIKAGFKGCDVVTLPVKATINYDVTPSISTTQSIVGCQESTVTLTASGAPVDGSYKWLDSNQQQISGATGSSFETGQLQDQTVYFVSALTSSGCESEKLEIDITGQPVEMPTISVSNDTLFAVSNTVVEWYRNGTLLENEKSMYLIPELNGNYTVLSNQNGCSVESDPVEYLVTGLNESTHDDLALMVYPNPTSKSNINYKIKSISTDAVKLKLVDIMGRTSYTKTMNPKDSSDGLKIESSVELKSGVYFITVEQGTKTIKKKLVILD